MGYKLVGMAVVRVGRWYARRRYGHLVPSRRTAVGAALGLAALGAAAALARRGGEG
jgi:hypothetical protein